MTQHVDLVKNEWLAGMQVRLVTASLQDDEMVLSDVTPGWEDLLNRPVRDAAGEAIYPAKEPARAWHELPNMYRGDYVFATGPHDEAECPFRHGPVLAMHGVEIKQV